MYQDQIAQQAKADYQRSALHGGGAAMGAAASFVAEGARTPEVAQQLARIERICSELASVTEVLGGRLSPIRRQTNTLAGNNQQQSAPTPILCGMASVLRDYGDSLERRCAEIQTMLNELEI